MAENSVSLLTPLLYVSTLLVALVVFSNVHRRRKQQKLAETPQFYQYNFAREIYEQLKNKEKVPPKLLKAALLAWGAEDITRLLRFQEHEKVVTGLLQQGLVGEPMFERFVGSKALTGLDVQEVFKESLELSPQWETFMQSSKEIAQQHAIRRRLAQMDVFKQEYYELAGTAPGKNNEAHEIENEIKG